MKSISKVFKFMAVLMTALVYSAPSAFAMSGEVARDNSTIVAVGFGVAPDYVRNPAQASMMARRAAIIDAYRQIAETIKGFQIDSESNTNNYALNSDWAKSKVSDFIQGAQIVSEQPGPDRSYTVTMHAPRYGGAHSLVGATVNKHTVKDTSPTPNPTVAHSNVQVNVNVDASANNRRSKGSLAAPAPEGRAIGNFTGLIIDCRAFGHIATIMSPVIKDTTGRKIYGHKNLDYKRVVEEGMAGYAYDLEHATRAGSNPLIVRAVSVEFGLAPVLSVADANRVLIENAASGFLERTRVVFVHSKTSLRRNKGHNS